MLGRIGQYILELAAITLIAILFICLSVPTPENATPDGLDLSGVQTNLFNPGYRQTGLEHERLAGVLLPIKIGLEHYGHIPTWNPYMGNGEPIINNAFSYMFNPFHSLPVLFADSFAEGTKIATFIALLLAGYNLWLLACAIGIGAVGRITAGAVYLMNGGIAGKFYVGHFQLALSLAWPPLVLAALWWTLRSKNRLAPVTFAVAFILLFFAGNIYYVLHTLLCAAVIIVFHLFERQTDTTSENIPFRRQFIFRRDRLKRAIFAGVFAFGLAGLQFFPVWLTRDYVDHDIQHFNEDGSLQGNYDLIAAARYFISDTNMLREDTSRNFDQAIAVDYTYVGQTVFILIVGALAVIVLRRKISTAVQSPCMVIIIAIVLASLMMIWGTGQTAILQFLYTHINLLQEFRFVGRAHAIAALWWIVLAGVALDILWNSAGNWLRTPPGFDLIERSRWIGASLIATGIWIYFVIYSVSNTSTRLSMVGNNVRFLNTLDERRFTSVSGVIIGLWAVVLVMIILDTFVLLAAHFIQRRRGKTVERSWRTYLTRGLRIGLLGLIFYGLNDVMTANSLLYKVEYQNVNFATFFPDIRKADNEPFPSINLPHAPNAFEVYEAEFRNWGVNEGWVPNSTESLLSWEAGTMMNLPRWAVVSNAYGGASQDYAQRLVDDNGPYQQIGCYKLENFDGDPCSFNGGVSAVLYERDDVLPYAFIVPADALLNLPSKLNGDTVYSVQITSHRQDNMTIQAQTPPVPGDYYLVVQENHFPGWQASTDSTALQTDSIPYFRDILNGDRSFIAVKMLEGSHTYSLWFEPPGFVLGIVVSLATAVLIGLYLIWPRLRKPKLEMQ